jgi:30S ribosomal protein S31
MGKGDKRTRRGKIFAGSFGKSRPKYKKKNATNVKPADKKTEE